MDNNATKKSGVILYSAKHTLNKLLYWMESNDGEKTYITKKDYDSLVNSNSTSNKVVDFDERKLTEEERLTMPCKAKKLNINTCGGITSVKLEEKTLTYEELEAGYDLRDCVLNSADLSNLDLSKCQLENVNLFGCDLSGSILPQNLKDVNFTNCKFDKNTIFINNDFWTSNTRLVAGFYDSNNNFNNVDFNGAKIVNPQNLYDQYIIKNYVEINLELTDSTKIQSSQIERA